MLFRLTNLSPVGSDSCGMHAYYASTFLAVNADWDCGQVTTGSWSVAGTAGHGGSSGHFAQISTL